MSISINSLPGPLDFMNMPVAWDIKSEAELSLTAGGMTDLFFSPDGGRRVENAPAVLFETRDPNFSLSARVRVEFVWTFDAGVLQIRAGENHWAKLCFEYSPFRQPMVVSVVTRGTSDDCNSTVIGGNEVYLRIARLGGAFAFHYSTDGEFWELVRHFALGGDEPLRIGFSAQSPTGQGCAAHFSAIKYQPRLLSDIRSGE